MSGTFEFEVEQYFQNNGKYFAQEDADIIYDLIINSDKSMAEINRIKFKSPKVAFVLSIMGGIIGLDRYYLGQYLLGFLKGVTYGGVFLWWIGDMGNIQRSACKRNLEILYTAITGNRLENGKGLTAAGIKNAVSDPKVKQSIKNLAKDVKKFGDSFGQEY